MVLIDGKEVEINGVKFIIHKAPATVAYNAALEYGMGQDNKDADAIMSKAGFTAWFSTDNL